MCDDMSVAQVEFTGRMHTRLSPTVFSTCWEVHLGSGLGVTRRVQRSDWLGLGPRTTSRKFTTACSTTSQIMTFLTPP